MQIERNAPENHKKKAERDLKAAAALKAHREAHKKKMDENKKYYLDQGKKHWEEFAKKQNDLVKAQRDAKVANSIFVPEEAKFFLVIRVKGLNKVPPKEKKILQLFRLRQLHNAVFVRNNKATLTMLRRIDPWVTYGYPTHNVIRQLVYKRGYGKINGQRIPFTSNLIIEEGLGKFGIKCVEDLIHEIHTCGPHFKEANNFLWPFKLSSPKGGLDAKRQPFLNGGDFGLREEFINEFAKRMI
jgi:large subunit ribosomal protein L7e